MEHWALKSLLIAVSLLPGYLLITVIRKKYFRIRDNLKDPVIFACAILFTIIFNLIYIMLLDIFLKTYRESPNLTFFKILRDQVCALGEINNFFQIVIINFTLFIYIFLAILSAYLFGIFISIGARKYTNSKFGIIFRKLSPSTRDINAFDNLYLKYRNEKIIEKTMEVKLYSKIEKNKYKILLNRIKFYFFGSIDFGMPEVIVSIGQGCYKGYLRWAPREYNSNSCPGIILEKARYFENCENARWGKDKDIIDEKKKDYFDDVVTVYIPLNTTRYLEVLKVSSVGTLGSGPHVK